MSSQEEKQILKMVETGKITPEEAMKLIEALDKSPDIDEEIFENGVEEIGNTGNNLDYEFENIKKRAQRYAMIPVWVGVAFTILGAYWMYTLVQTSNFGFWFICAWVPLLFGLLLLALSGSGRNSRWLYVNVDQKEGEWPRHITFGLPVPLGIINWFFKNFGHFFRGIDNTKVDEIINALSLTKHLNEPLIVDFDEGEQGEKVQVYIG